MSSSTEATPKTIVILNGPADWPSWDREFTATMAIHGLLPYFQGTKELLAEPDEDFNAFDEFEAYRSAELLKVAQPLQPITPTTSINEDDDGTNQPPRSVECSHQGSFVPTPPHSPVQQHFATQMADSSDRAQRIIHAALLRHPKDRSLERIDIHNARTFITFVFGHGRVKYGDKPKKHAFQQLDSATLVALGVLIRLRDIRANSTSAIKALCTKAPSLISETCWYNNLDLWNASLGVVSSSAVYWKFRNDAVDAIQRAAGDLDDAPGSGAPPASAVPAPASATPMAAQPSGTGEPYAGTTSTDSQDALPVPRSSHKRPRVEADDASSVAFQAPVISSDLRAAAPFLIQPGLGQAPPPTPHGDGNWTRSPCESPTSQPHGIDSRASHPLPALPTADPQPERSVVHILFRPSSDMFEAAFPGVGLISAMAKSKQEFVGGRGYSAIANFYIYDDMATEMDICLGRADEQSCAYAADRVRTILGNVPGVSVEVQQVCQMKIVVLPHPESVHVGSMLAGIFI